MASNAKISPLAIPIIRRRKVRKPAPGSPPGTFEFPPDRPPVQMYRFSFGPQEIEEGAVPEQELEKALTPQPGRVLWLDIQGLPRAEILERLGTGLGLSPLTLEDIVHTAQRPKLEEFDDYLFVVIREYRRLKTGEIESDQISFILKPGLLVTIQEIPGDDFDPVRKRLRDARSQLRRNGADYLAYALIDATIDSYFPVLETIGEAMDRLEDSVWRNPNPEVSAAVHRMRRELRHLRRAVWPLRDVAATLGRVEIESITEQTRISFRDCHDHSLQVADFLETSHERASDLADLYLTIISERTNQVMKVLTVIGTIFLPLTFLCGVYGMNFDRASPLNMPELGWRFGYLAFWAVTLVIAVGMLILFFRRGWLGNRNPAARSTGKKNSKKGGGTT